MSKRRVVLSLVGKSVLSLLALLVITTVLHESAHFVTAVIMRVPIASFAWFDPRYFAPTFTSASTEHTTGATIVSYAGGLVTGVLLLSILVTKKKWFVGSLYRWFLGFYIATFGTWHVCQGILEGAFHDMYIADATDPFNLSYLIGYASAVVGMVLYWILMPGLRDSIIQERNRRDLKQYSVD